MLPLGIESFSEIRKENFYYIDKTGFIRDLLNSWGKANLFTRPRRFGKSLNMSMLRIFFEIGADTSVFDGLEISKEKSLCDSYCGKFPVISISLKDVDGGSYDYALIKISSAIQKEMRRHQYLLQSSKLSDIDKEMLKSCILGNLNESTQENSIYFLSEMLYRHFGQKIILLIDEYDVPLDKAYINGYYSDMARHIRLLFSESLKGNEYLQFAVITGCLRISKESIFTGLNNFKVRSITDTAYASYFGFTDSEVKEMLDYYNMDFLYGTVKEWYDGYMFGKTHVYCPWDVINYVAEHLEDIETPAKMYWINTSGNSIIRKLIKQADSTMKEEIGLLIDGKSINKEIKMELTYQDLDNEESNIQDNRTASLWSILFTTGYLTILHPSENARNYELVIPNKEIRNIFITQVNEWFADTIIYGDTKRLQQFCHSIQNGDTETFEDMFNNYLEDTISIHDTSTAKPMKENFYHGLLLGLLRANSKWKVKSNLESGNGFADILLETYPEKTGCVFEIKYAENAAFNAACKKAIEQIENKNYTSVLIQDGMKIIHKYGVACYKKTCKITHI